MADPEAPPAAAAAGALAVAGAPAAAGEEEPAEVSEEELKKIEEERIREEEERIRLEEEEKKLEDEQMREEEDERKRIEGARLQMLTEAAEEEVGLLKTENVELQRRVCTLQRKRRSVNVEQFILEGQNAYYRALILAILWGGFVFGNNSGVRPQYVKFDPSAPRD